jgi:hypothetical protein
MAETKYGKYIKNEPIMELIGVPEVTAEIFRVSANRDWGKGFGLGLMCMDKPFLMVKEAMYHDFDQILGFFGSDLMRVRDFDAEVELYLGEEQEKHVITKSSYVYLPAGLLHGPLNFKRVGKPVVFLDISLTEKYVRKLKSGEVVEIPE